MTLHETQLALEIEMVELGKERYFNALEARGTDVSQPGSALIANAVERIALTLASNIEGFAAGKAGKYARTVLDKIGTVDPQVCAYIALRRSVHAEGVSGRGEPLTTVAVSVGALIEEHVVFESFRAAEGGLARWWEDRAKHTNHLGHARKVMRAGAQGNGAEMDWTEEEKLKVGLYLIDLLIDTGLVKVTDEPMKKGVRSMLQLGDEVREFLSRAHEACALAAPFTLPMVIPPQPWTSPFEGGYLTRRTSLMTGRISKAAVDDLASADLRQVYSALNAIQDTPWRVNAPVLAVLEGLINSPAGAPGVPPAEDEPLPPRPTDIPSDVAISDLSEDQQRRLGEWRKVTKEAHDARAKRFSQRSALAQKLYVARRFADFEAIYFPHQIDSRGRVYPVSAGLNPQGDDLAKALLTFADGLPLGEDGAYWLAVHIANSWGEDKVTLDERAQWTLDNEELILEVALNPLDTVEQWACADKPWCFLAAAFEWAGYVLSGRSEEFVSHLPVAMDGSCSGLQHFSAALRDEVGGTAVNLVPTGKVEDIYTEVANRVNARLNSSTCGDDLLPWRGKVDRKTVKQPCMTYAYSSTVSGMRDMILAATAKKDAADQPQGDLFALCSKLTPVVRECIEETVIAAASGMAFLKEVAGIATDEGKVLRWVAPSGLPVHQRKTRPESQRVSVWYSGQRTQLRLMSSGTVLDKTGQKNAVAANWVHSMDAAHLMAVVNEAVREEIFSFAMIHDSFGTHAGAITDLNQIIRETFVQQYEVDRLAEFRAAMAEQLATELPALPPMGSLDLGAVRGSDYFFA